MPFYRPSSIPYLDTRKGVGVKSITGEKAQLTFVLLEPGTTTHHSHPNEQLGVIFTGLVDLDIGGETRRLGPGDAYLIPSGVEHGFTVPAGNPLEYAEVFVPPKEENRTPGIEEARI